ncbi:MAG: GspMb/PilO family protein [Terriglobia bacterium]
MAHSRRRVLAQKLLKALLVLVLLDALVYFLVNRPLEVWVRDTQERFTTTRLTWRQEKIRAARLEKRASALPAAGEQVDAFIQKRIPPRRLGFSRAARLVQQLSQQSGVQLDSLSYRLQEKPAAPLDDLGISVAIEGDFPKLMAFTHALETSQDLVVVRQFRFEQGDQGVLGLHLMADLYLLP